MYEMMDAYWPAAADQPNTTKYDIEHAALYNSVAQSCSVQIYEG